MTLNNFEKRVKETLDKREMNPSERAWEEVSSALEEKGSSGKRNYFWYGIAASFVGILIVSVIYFNSEDLTIPNEVQIVNTQDDKIEEVQSRTPGEQEHFIPQQIQKKPEEIVDNIRSDIKSQNNQEPERTLGLASVEKSPSESTPLKVTPTATEKVIDTKLMEVIAQVDLLERNNASLTDAEVDSLLWQAQKEIITEKLFRGDGSVDATALLNEVEDELDQSFRDQIFEKLKTGFIKVRTAVADRNN